MTDKGGKVIDIGCDNCMLLKFICEFSGYKIETLGIDWNIKAIDSAKRNVLPKVSKNFIINDIDSCLQLKNRFNLIICNPFHSARNYINIVQSSFKMPTPLGK